MLILKAVNSITRFLWRFSVISGHGLSDSYTEATGLAGGSIIRWFADNSCSYLKSGHSFHRQSHVIHFIYLYVGTVRLPPLCQCLYAQSQLGIRIVPISQHYHHSGRFQICLFSSYAHKIFNEEPWLSVHMVLELGFFISKLAASMWCLGLKILDACAGVFSFMGQLSHCLHIEWEHYAGIIQGQHSI